MSKRNNMSKCTWCGTLVSNLIHGQCFECYSMGVIHSMGSTIEYAEYGMLSDDTDRMHCIAWVLPSTLYLFGNSTCNSN